MKKLVTLCWGLMLTAFVSLANAKDGFTKSYEMLVNGDPHTVSIGPQGQLTVRAQDRIVRLDVINGQPILRRHSNFGMIEMIPDLSGEALQGVDIQQFVQRLHAQNSIHLKTDDGLVPLMHSPHTKSCMGAGFGLAGAGVAVGLACSGPQAATGSCLAAFLVYLSASDNYWGECLTNREE